MDKGRYIIWLVVISMLVIILSSILIYRYEISRRTIIVGEFVEIHDCMGVVNDTILLDFENDCERTKIYDNELVRVTGIKKPYFSNKQCPKLYDGKVQCDSMVLRKTESIQVVEPEAQFLFIEYTQYQDTRIVAGNPASTSIDFPTYWFNEEYKMLAGVIDFEINKSLIVIAGGGTILSGDVGDGAGTRLTGVYKIPYESGELAISEIKDSGQVVLMYRKQMIILDQGESWEQNVSEIQEWASLDDSSALVEVTTRHRINNHGFIFKELIKEDQFF